MIWVQDIFISVRHLSSLSLELLCLMGSLIICMPSLHLHRGENDMWARRQWKEAVIVRKTCIPFPQAWATLLPWSFTDVYFWGCYISFLTKITENRTLRKPFKKVVSCYCYGISWQKRLWSFISSGEVPRTEDRGNGESIIFVTK